MYVVSVEHDLPKMHRLEFLVTKEIIKQEMVSKQACLLSRYEMRYICTFYVSVCIRQINKYSGLTVKSWTSSSIGKRFILCDV